MIAHTSRPPAWKWIVCVILFFATTLMYMDRLTLTQMSARMIGYFEMDPLEYAWLDSGFSVAFAAGAIIFGFLVDRYSVWFIYPAVVLLWSLAGTVTGFVDYYWVLLLCRIWLGFTESGHWPCSLKTTQKILTPEQRTLGNSILQSGAAISSVVTPLIILYMLHLYNSWRPPFIVIGSLGLAWVFLWFTWVHPRDVALETPLPQGQGSSSHPTPLPPGRGASVEPSRFADVFADRRFWILVVVVVCINSSWHFFRVWMPYFLQTKHGYSETDTQWVTSAYYLVTDVGSLIAGVFTYLFARAGMSVHGSRMLVFSVCASLTTASLAMIFLSKGPGLIGALLIVSLGALGLFPPFYSFSQELSVHHQGKVTGMLGCLNWLAMAPMRLLEGKYIKDTGNYDLGLSLAGIMPLVAVAALFFFWPTSKNISN